MPIRPILASALALALWAAGSARLRAQRIDPPDFFGRAVAHEVVDMWTPAPADSFVLLPVHYAKHRILDPDAWSPAARVGKTPKEILLVYSWYPPDTARWITQYYELMHNRFAALYKLDPALQDADIPRKMIAQTACSTAALAKQAYHGFVLVYQPTGAAEGRPDARLADGKPKKTMPRLVIPPPDTSHGFTAGVTVGTPREEELKPDDAPRPIAPRANPFERRQGEDDIPPEDEGGVAKNHIERTMNMVKGVVGGVFPLPDSIVYKTLSRKTDWQNLLVVIDWTGSMYEYGAQVISWNEKYIKEGRLKYLAIFNDGDDYRQKDGMTERIKPPGRTGGIYYSEPKDLEEVLATLEEALKNGDGGDLPENDLEAVLKATERYPDAGQVVLIADRSSAVRDMMLLDAIKRPVQVVACGSEFSIHPDYFTIAWRTGGSVINHQEEYVFPEPMGRVPRGGIKLSPKVKYVLNRRAREFEMVDKRRR